MLKASSKQPSKWNSSFLFACIAYISQLPFWDRWDIWPSFDTAFIVIFEKFLPLWMPAMMGSLLDSLYDHPMGMTPLVFALCQIFAYFTRNLWRHKWIYIGIGITVAIVIQGILIQTIYQKSFNYTASFKGLVLAMFVCIVAEPFLSLLKMNKTSHHKKKKRAAHVARKTNQTLKK